MTDVLLQFARKSTPPEPLTVFAVKSHDNEPQGHPGSRESGSTMPLT